MIVLDEQLQGLRLEVEIARWYHGRVCFVRSLRPGSIVKDDGIPHLLRLARHPTFITEDWADFWQRAPAHRDFCIVCFALPSEQARDIARLLRRLFRVPAFQTQATRMGKIARVSGGQVTYYQARDSQTYVLPLP